MEDIPESLRPGVEAMDGPNVVQMDVFEPTMIDSAGTQFDPNPPQETHESLCPCTCGACCCRRRDTPTPIPIPPPGQPEEPGEPELKEWDAVTVGYESTVGIGPHVTNVDPFDRKEPMEVAEDTAETEHLPIPQPVIEPIGDPAFTPLMMSPISEQLNVVSPLPADSPLGLDVFPLSPMPLDNPLLETPSDNTPPDIPPKDPVVEEEPPPQRPDFNLILEDPPDFGTSGHRKTMQLIYRIKPIFVDCLDVLYEILPKLDELRSIVDVQSKQDVCLDLEDTLKTLWFTLPPRHSCDDTRDCRHWHQRYVERMEQLAEKMVSFLDELKTPQEVSKFSFRMDQYHRVFEKWIKKFEQYHSLIRVNPEP